MSVSYTVSQENSYNLVTWKIITSTPVVLSRGAISENYNGEIIPPYVFGSAFWAVYINYGINPPPSLIKYPEGLSFAFVFTENTEIDEVFPSGFEPYQPQLIEVTGGVKVNECIGYPDYVNTLWQEQTGSAMTGYVPNPKMLTTTQYSASEGTFLVPASIGNCGLFSDANLVVYTVFGGIIADAIRKLK